MRYNAGVPRRRRVWVAALVAVLLAVAVLLGAWSILQPRLDPPDVRGSATVEFDPSDVPSRARGARPPRPAPARPSGADDVVWPTYGYDSRRLRSTPRFRHRPPFRRTWTFRGRALLEFPPAVAYGRLYLPTFDGRFYALDTRTGETVWKYASGRCSWGTPAVARRLVYATFLSRGPRCETETFTPVGEVVAFDADSGRVRWRARMGVNESSPLVAGGLVYVGDWDGRVLALDARTGRRRWEYRTGGAVKGSAALADGKLVIGAYDGRLYALAARSGRLLWRASSQPRLGSSGRFYSTPALAYGRAFIGSTDGKVYAYGLSSGRLLWSTTTGGYVYSSPAVWRGRVLIGSYDGHFYALDAATGAVRWRFRANGPISGSATVLGRVVYFSTLAERTYALDAATGRPLWTFPDGKYSPVVADRERVYLVGLGRLYGMVERRP
jgi:outer membrane protein assembly factor BamB